MALSASSSPIWLRSQSASGLGASEASPQPRLRRGEFVTAAWAIALLVAMFALKWFGVDNVPGKDTSAVSAVDAWNGLSVLRWLMLATVLLAVGSAALHISQGGHGSQTDTSRALAWAATLVAAGLVYRVQIALPRADAVVDQKLGALLGLGCALGMTAGAWQTRRAFVAAARAPVVHRRRRPGAPPLPVPADATPAPVDTTPAPADPPPGGDPAPADPPAPPAVPVQPSSSGAP